MSGVGGNVEVVTGLSESGASGSVLPHSTTSLSSSGDVSIRSGVGRDAKDSIVAT